MEETVLLLSSGKFMIIQCIDNVQPIHPAFAATFLLKLVNEWYPDAVIYVPLNILSYIMLRFESSVTNECL
jgi:hypothetical protein